MWNLFEGVPKLFRTWRREFVAIAPQIPEDLRGRLSAGDIVAQDRHDLTAGL